MGEVSKSAELAREMGYLRASDRIVMNHFELLHVAKQEALALVATAYRPPLIQRQIPVAGRAGIACADHFRASYPGRELRQLVPRGRARRRHGDRIRQTGTAAV